MSETTRAPRTLVGRVVSDKMEKSARFSWSAR